MKRRIFLLFSIITVALLAMQVYAAEAVPKKVLDKTDSVVRVWVEYIDGSECSGTGFVIENDKKSLLVVTNEHVVEGEPYKIYVYAGDEKLPAIVIASTEQKDMAVLKLDYALNLQPVKLAAKSAKQGDSVYAAGFPGASDVLTDELAHNSEDVTITDGIISAVRQYTMSDYGTSTTLLQMNAAISGGNSGGPLFNTKGQVVGINTLGISEVQGIFGAIDVSELKEFLDINGIKISSSNTAYIMVAVASALVLISFAVCASIVKKRKKDVMMQKCAEQTEASFEPDTKTEDIKHKNKKIKTSRLLTAILLVGLIILAGVYSSAVMYIRSEAFVTADKVVSLPGIRLVNKQLYEYSNAAKLLNIGEIETAKERFKGMGDYLFAAEFVKEADYRKAQQLADKDNFADAISLYINLSNDGYRDSEEKLLETRYRNGMYQFAQGNVIVALDILDDLRNIYEPANTKFETVQMMAFEQLLDSEQYLSAHNVIQLEPDNFSSEEKDIMRDIIYMQGQTCYYEEKYPEAKKYFEAVFDYADSKKYITLIYVADGGYYTDVQKCIEKLTEIIGFENAEEWLMFCRWYAKAE